MSTDNPTPEGPPLDPHTLRVVIERLGERITHAEAERENDASEGLPADEMADWDTRIEALELARWDIENIAKTANPRARVVVLPEPNAPNGARGKLWRTSSGIRVCTGPDGENLVSSGGALMVADDAAQLARAILAAAEFTGGAQ